MRTIAFLAFISAPEAVVAFHPTQVSSPTSAHSTSRLDARRQELSELDKLTLKRLALRRPEPEPIHVEEEEEDGYYYDMPMEYLYDDTDNEVRYDDDAPFHVLLLPS